MCAKSILGDKLKAGFVEYGRGEKIHEAFDLNNRRLGQNAPICVLVKDKTVHYNPQKNWDADQMTNFIFNQVGTTYKSPVPYPLNDMTMKWEYIKKNAAAD